MKLINYSSFTSMFRNHRLLTFFKILSILTYFVHLLLNLHVLWPSMHYVCPSSFFLQTYFSEVTERNSTKLGHMLGSELYLKGGAKFRDSSLKTWAPNCPFLVVLRSTYKCQYLRQGTCYKRMENTFVNYEESPAIKIR